MDFGTLFIVIVVAPVAGIGFAGWAMIDAWTVKNGSVIPTLIVAALSACVNVGLLAISGFRFQWITLAPWLAAMLTVAAVWRTCKR